MDKRDKRIDVPLTTTAYVMMSTGLICKNIRISIHCFYGLEFKAGVAYLYTFSWTYSELYDK